MAIIFITKGKTNWKYILIIVILALIVAGESFLLLKQRINIPETKLPERVTKDETADWKTYSNPEANFTFRYPPSWEIKEDYLYKDAEEKTVCLGEIGGQVSCLILINVPQTPCPTREISELGHTNFIGTCSEDSEILNIYEKVLDSFRVVE